MTLFSNKRRFFQKVFTPNRWIGLFTLSIGVLFLKPLLRQIVPFISQAAEHFTDWKTLLSAFGLLTLPQVMMGIAIILMSFGLFLRARVAWSFSLIVLIVVALFNFLLPTGNPVIGYLSVLDCLFLLLFWREFSQSSLAAGTLFALISVTSLLTYALCGSLWLGDQFNPQINELSTALYFATVSMSTVGFGDIVPASATARLFTVSIIILGITVFATSLSAIIGPVIGGNLKRMIKGRISHAMRKNHMIIVGATPLALSVYHGLTERHETVTVIVPPGTHHDYPPETDLVIDDPSSDKALRAAGADKAKFILVLRNDDSDNAFIVLAAREVVSAGTKILALVNSDKNLSKIKRVQPDILFSLQTLASELLLRKLSGESLDTGNLMELLFQDAH